LRLVEPEDCLLSQRSCYELSDLLSQRSSNEIIDIAHRG